MIRYYQSAWWFYKFSLLEPRKFIESSMENMYNDVRVCRVKTTVDIESRTKLSSQHFWSSKNSWWKINPFINRSNQRLISSYKIKKYFICLCKRRQGNILIKTLFLNFLLWKTWSRECAAIILRSCEKKHLFSKGGKKRLSPWE